MAKDKNKGQTSNNRPRNARKSISLQRVDLVEATPKKKKRTDEMKQTRIKRELAPQLDAPKNSKPEGLEIRKLDQPSTEDAGLDQTTEEQERICISKEESEDMVGESKEGEEGRKETFFNHLLMGLLGYAFFPS